MNRRWVRAGIVLSGAAVAVAIQIAARPRLMAVERTDVQAPRRLSETGLYAQGKVGIVDQRNRQFSPQYPLWSDGAVKTRLV